MDAIVHRLPHPKGRRTYGAYASLDEAKAGAHLLLRTGKPHGMAFSIFERLGAFVLIGYSTTPTHKP